MLCGNVKDLGGTIKRNLNPATDLVDEERSTARVQVVFDSVRGGPHRPGHKGRGKNDSLPPPFRSAATLPSASSSVTGT